MNYRNYLLHLNSASLVITSTLIASSSFAQTEPSGAWLDSTMNWNRPDASIPQAPQQEGNNLSSCQRTIRPSVLPEDKLVTAAGWTLTEAAQIYGATTIVMGMADADGMCRPLDYQVFVFTNGDFSGTISPIPMDARTDGSLFDLNLYREGFINASFNRYTSEDPLCCASGESRVFYQVNIENDASLLVPQLPAQTVTRPNS